MTLARSNRFPPPLRATSHWKASICAAFALAVLGAKLWIISRYANPTPLVDDWDAQAADLFVPLSCPEFLVLELANALKTGRRFTAAEIKVIADSFRALDLVLETLSWSTLAKAVELAASLNAAVYDSYFLASAIESSSTLVTADDLFARKVGKHPNLLALRHFHLPA